MAETLFFEDKIIRLFPGETLLAALRRSGIPLAASCGGKNRCGACRIRLLSGSFLHDGKPLEISPETPADLNACALRQISAVGKAAYLPRDDALCRCDLELPPLPSFPTYRRGTFIALDLGSTNVAAAIIQNGKICRCAETPNRQSRFGSNVIDRIAFAALPENFKRLREALIRETVLPLLDKLLTPDLPVERITACGNTAMSCFFAGIDPAPLGQAPFELGKVSFDLTAQAAGLDRFAPDLPVKCVPHLCSFIGGDVLAGISVTDFGSPQNIELYLDIGTNCEMILNKKGTFYALSAAAGPAFERNGSVHGAIRHLDFRENAWQLFPNAPSGTRLCGTALNDLLCEAHKAGFLDNFGRWIKAPGLPENLIPSEEELSELVTAKAAISSGLRLLFRKADISAAEISKVYLAGTFAFHLDISRAVYTGLLPDLPENRFLKTGNAALAGAAARTLFPETVQKTEPLENNIIHINPAEEPDCMHFFASAMKITK